MESAFIHTRWTRSVDLGGQGQGGALVKKQVVMAGSDQVAAVAASGRARGGGGVGSAWRSSRSFPWTRFCSVQRSRSSKTTHGWEQGSTALRGAEPHGAPRLSDVGLGAPFSDVIKFVEEEKQKEEEHEERMLELNRWSAATCRFLRPSWRSRKG